MDYLYKYDIYAPDGRMIGKDIPRNKIPELIDTTRLTLNECLRHLGIGQKITLKQYTIVCSYEKKETGIRSSKATLADMMSEWDKVCRPFRILAQRRKNDRSAM